MQAALAGSLLLLLAGCAARPDPPPAPTPATAETVSYLSGKETVHGFLCRPAGTGPFPAVVAIHDDYGLTDWVKERAGHLAERGFVALAVDLYRGQGAADLMDAHILSRGLPDEQVQADLKAAVDYLCQRPEVQADGIGVLGWDIGGGYALDAALQDPRLRAVVTCYGRPTTDPALLKPLNAPVLGIFAGKDEGIPAETVAQFKAAMQKAGKRVTIEVYPASGHGFLSPAGGAAPDPAAADAWDRIDAYLAAELGH
jgi:carboxymethylenebutenolidase